ncbi:NFX1-type zinc finger-containing protein 1-like isoform X2 [Conger conger]|uniref:NFX1-type zinc finger-containing protein 1-like isoform X2 n=1 Tax=Conger conger TaxID=82655 RepID=UPI002A5AEDE7|nr:NFX1-type zinc finger-containing protein 1-like isoform X2 [Conger conger]
MSGSGGQRGVRLTQHQGHGRPSSRGSREKEEHWGTEAPNGHSQNKGGRGRLQSRSRKVEAGGSSRWRGEHSKQTALFQHCPPPAGADVQIQETVRPVRPGEEATTDLWDRLKNLSLHPMKNPSRIPAVGVPKSQGNPRPPNGTKGCSATKNEHSSHRGQLGPSNRTSQPNLFELSHRLQSREHRPRRGETPQDPDHKPTHRLDFRSLEKILQMEPSEVVMKLAAPGSGLKELLNRKNTTDRLTHITLDVLSKARNCRTKSYNLQHLLSEVKDSQFLKGTIPMFVKTLGATLGTNDQGRRGQNIARFKQIIDLHITLMSVFPSSTINALHLTQLQKVGVTIGEDVYKSLGKLQNMAAHLQENKQDGTLWSDTYSFLPGRLEESVGDFRLMSVFPTYEDVHTTKLPFLRPNIVEEKFKDGETYLDTHFRLLREDFIKPLRDGISQLLHFKGKDLRQGRFDDIRIYFNAQIITPVCTPKGILYMVKFDKKNLKIVNWESSKRLLFGALVCLSMDNFQTMIFATVANRDVKDLQKGITALFFTEESRSKLADMSPNDVFLMVENMAFFEAYRHVLEGLQEMSIEDFPMQRYIVSCEKDISPPKYVLAHRHGYSLEALKNNNQLKTQSLHMKQRPFFSAMAMDSKHTTRRHTVRDILNFSDWPSKEMLGLDESQMKAVRLALTKELAIIQGPPGTGKTFVGLKIVKALLDNADMWRSTAGSPILVVCYTNHALDQFLEGILKFMSKSSVLVRLGGRSTNDALKKLSLTNLRNQGKFWQNLPGHLRTMKFKLKEERKILEGKIESLAAMFASSAKGVIHESVLKEYILSLHGVTLGRQLGRGGGSCRRKAQSLMLDWLGISLSTHSSRTIGWDEQVSWEEASCTVDDLARVTEVLSLGPLDSGDSASDVTEGDGDVANLLQVTEEAEKMQAERIMEGDDMQKHIHSALKRREAREREDLAFVLKDNDEPEEDGDEGWEITRAMKKKLKNVVKQELEKTDHMLEESAKRIRDLWAVPEKQRWHLYRLWLSKYRRNLRVKILSHENEYQSIVHRMDELRQLEDKTLLRSASVIGMTTTCAARCRRVLQDIQPRIVVVEEAAEVLEAHIITTLTSACQHLILIGDHQQLRPSTAVYELAKDFNLEVSLFERLVHMDVPYVRLDYQHRMRPEIAKLLTPHIYDKLKNHSSVHLYENIKGVTTNVFFVDHEHLEENIQEGHSHQNMHEATFVKALCHYLMCQGYKPSQITILTTYNGQLSCLKKIMPKSIFQGVNLCVVDRYQGEENDIVILSLVRSNKERRVGFLKIPNRVCVALSRARKALFCISNMTMLSSVPLWSKIMAVLSRNQQIGKALMLRCENHPATITEVSKQEDFLKVPLGGCGVPCEYRLDCGHVCTRLCHPTDSDHKLFKCTKPCTKTLCQDGHRCPKKCSEECGECQVIVTRTMPKCGHEQEVPCSHSLDSFICQVPCNKMLQCGHLCVRGCGESCTENCPQRVTVPLDCGHQRVMQCHVKQEVDNNQEQVKCWKKCDAELECGHICLGSCFQCAGGSMHLPCASPCNTQLICFHRCQQVCKQGCMPCSKPCETQCYHRKCPKLCSEACPPCTDPCGWRCKHHECTRLCHEPCDRPPCNVACYRKLKCGHSCIGMCGEPCPNKCRVCNADEVLKLFVSSEANPKARFVQLADCNHIFEVTGFDSWMASPEENGAIRQKSCPKCQTPIRRSVRYNAIIKSAQLDMETMKKKAAVMLVEHIQSTVKEKEKKGIKSPEIAPLLSKLTGADLGRVALLGEQITLLSQLAEIEWNVMMDMPLRHRITIDHAVHLCIKKVATAKPTQVSECQTEVKRILCLAEAYGLAAIYSKPRHPVFFANWLTPEQLQGVISKLLANKPPLSNPDLKNMQEVLNGIAKEISPSTKWKMLEDTTDVSTVLSCKFLKLAHWFKCSRGHVYYRESADTNSQSELCPECLTE